VERDIPALLAALPEWDIRAAALKGRSNFLCLQDMNVASMELWTQGDPLFKQIVRWSNETDTGDVAELDFSFTGWSDISANPDTCRQRECRHYDRCFYFKARKNAEECNLLVVNHALFFADLRLRKENPNGSSLLPKYDAVVFDEAHHIDEMATRAFGLEWGSARVPQLVRRVKRLLPESDGLIDPAHLSSLEALNQVVLDPFFQSESAEAYVDDLLGSDAEKRVFRDRRDDLCVGLDALARDLTKLADHTKDSVLKDRAAGLARTATRISTELTQVTRDDDAEPAPDANSPGYFRWFHTRRGRQNLPAHATLVKTPRAIDRTLQNVLFADTPRVIFTSATLASGGKFDFLKKRLGLVREDGDAEAEAPVEVVEGSPFDFQKNCLLYVPRHLGAPSNSPDYVDRVADEVTRLVEAAGGRTFALFTSHRMLRAVQEKLWDATDYPLFVQGTMPNGRLVDEFVKAGDGVLLGTASFWEGVDVPGPALSLVIIDKLPFAAPDSPTQRAREDAIKTVGGDAFREYSLPQAQIRLKQGFGRLLRAPGDRGVVAILDARLWTKYYGRDFLADLPPCPRTDRTEEVERFFRPAPAVGTPT
jgi:ATP-dependent DNA helicase DinG